MKQANTKKQIRESGKAAIRRALVFSGTRWAGCGEAVGLAAAGERSAVYLENTALKNAAAEFTSSGSLPIPLLVCAEKKQAPQFKPFIDATSSFFKVVFYASTVQEAQDLALIGQWVAEKTLTPVLCLLDARGCANSIQNLVTVDENAVRPWLGKPDDAVEAGDEARALLLGKKHRRLPQWLSISQPLGLHARLEEDRAQQARSARNIYFDSALQAVIDRAFEEFAARFGRRYHSTHSTGKGSHVILGGGWLARNLASVAYKGKVVRLTQLAPFPSQKLQQELQKVRGLTLLNHDDWADAFQLRETLGHLNPGMRIFTAHLQGMRLTENAIQHLLHHHEQEAASGDFYPMVTAATDLSRFPLLQGLQQRLSRNYPQLERALARITQNPLPRKDIRHIMLNASVGHSPEIFGPLLSRLPRAEAVRSYHIEKRSAYLPYVETHIFAGNPETIFFPSDGVDYILASDVRYVDGVERLKEGGVLIINSPFDDAQTWDQLPQTVRTLITEKNITLLTVNGTDYALKAARTPSQQAGLMMMLLLGAWASREGETEELLPALRSVITGGQVKTLTRAFVEGRENVKQIEWRKLPAYESLKEADILKTPWAINRDGLFDKTVFDPSYFWDTVGYLYKERQQNKLLTDPMIATETVPARTSTFRDLSPSHTYIPEFHAENCTACGLCWANCPESALPTVIFTAGDLWQAAVKRAAEADHSLNQLSRLQNNLIKLADKRLKDSLPADMRDAGALFEQSFEFLMDKLQADEEKEEGLRSEFNGILPFLSGFPLVKSQSFYEQPEQTSKGSGRLLSIVINPYTCKGCSACISICPDQALERIEARPDIIETYKRQFELMSGLPENRQSEFDDFIDADNREMYRLINRTAYLSMPGGDNGLPGSGVKTAVHLALSAMETALQPKRQEWLEELNSTIHRLEVKAQNLLNEAVDLNSFDDFYQRLHELDSAEEGIGQLITSREKEQKSSKARTQKLKQYSSLIHRLKEDRQLLSRGGDGYGASVLGMVFNAEGALSWMADYPYNPFAYPWLNSNSSQLMEKARGMFEGFVQQLLPVFNHLREAATLLEGSRTAYRSAGGWEDLSVSEKSWCPAVIIFMDRSGFDSQFMNTFGPWSASGKPIQTVVINAATDKVPDDAFNPALWALGWENIRTLQTSPGYHGATIRMIREAVASRQPAFIFSDANEPYRQGIAEDRAWQQHQRAVATRVFPLLDYAPQRSAFYGERFDLSANPDHEADWVETILEVTATTPVTQIKYRLTPADWAMYEARYQHDFSEIAPSEWGDQWRTVADYLDLDEEEQAKTRPYVIYVDDEGRRHRLAASERVIHLCRVKKHQWRLLQQLSGIIRYEPQYQQEKLEQAVQSALEGQERQLRAEYEGRLRELDEHHFAVYHDRLKNKLLQLYRQRRAESMENGKDAGQ